MEWLSSLYNPFTEYLANDTLKGMKLLGVWVSIQYVLMSMDPGNVDALLVLVTKMLAVHAFILIIWTSQVILLLS